MTKFALCQWLI